ncbi:MAG TPA: hypothetical protein VF595_08570 [Tepidisphaeraceae bacterium]|jgi:hypothetical protein
MHEKNGKPASGLHYVTLPSYIVRLQSKGERRLLPATMSVLIAMCAQRDFKTGQVSMSIEAIRENAGLTAGRYVHPALAELHALGVIRTVRESKPGRGNRAVWLINFTAEPWSAGNPETVSRGSGFTDVNPVATTVPQETVFLDETGAQTGAQKGAQTGAQSDPIRNSLSKSLPEEARADGNEDEKHDPAKTGQRPQRHPPTPIDRATPEKVAALDAAIGAFDRWAMLPPPQGVGYVIRKNNNDHLPVVALLAELEPLPPMLWGGTRVARHTLIPEAVERLIKQPKEFMSIKHAVGCVRRELAAWANGNVPKLENGQVQKPAAPVAYGRRFS